MLIRSLFFPPFIVGNILHINTHKVTQHSAGIHTYTHTLLDVPSLLSNPLSPYLSDKPLHFLLSYSITPCQDVCVYVCVCDGGWCRYSLPSYIRCVQGQCKRILSYNVAVQNQEVNIWMSGDRSFVQFNWPWENNRKGSSHVGRKSTISCGYGSRGLWRCYSSRWQLMAP